MLDLEIVRSASSNWFIPTAKQVKCCAAVRVFIRRLHDAARCSKSITSDALAFTQIRLRYVIQAKFEIE
jgi:hypothetical protein